MKRQITPDYYLGGDAISIKSTFRCEGGAIFLKFGENAGKRKLLVRAGKRKSTRLQKKKERKDLPSSSADYREEKKHEKKKNIALQ